MKKLLVDGHIFDGKYQGSRTFIKELFTCNVFHNEDVDIYFASNDIDKLKKSFEKFPKLKFIKLNSRNKWIRNFLEIPLIVRKYKFDFIHLNYFTPPFIPKFCKKIVTIHDILFIDYPRFFPFWYRIRNRILFNLSAINANIICTVSNYSADRIAKHYGMDRKEIIVVPNAVNNKFQKEYDFIKAKHAIHQKYGVHNYVIYVSRLEPRKNHEMVFNIFNDIWSEGIDINLVLIGAADKEFASNTKLLSTMSDLRFFHFENVPDEDLIAFYKASKLSIYPSICEGFGIPPIESASLKTPTLCSANTAMSDFTFFDSWLLDPYKPQVWKEKILELILNGDDYSEKTQRISMQIKEKYNWDFSASILMNKLLSLSAN